MKKTYCAISVTQIPFDLHFFQKRIEYSYPRKNISVSFKESNKCFDYLLQHKIIYVFSILDLKQRTEYLLLLKCFAQFGKKKF